MGRTSLRALGHPVEARAASATELKGKARTALAAYLGALGLGAACHTGAHKYRSGGCLGGSESTGEESFPVEHRQEICPRSNLRAVLVGKRPCDLDHVPVIVSHPRGKELAQCNRTKGGMDACTL